MRHVLGCVRRADRDFRLIEEGDRILVGLSGGKDSMALLRALALYRHFCPNSYTLEAAHLCLGLSEENIEGMKEFCAQNDVPLHLIDSQIGDIVLNQRKEKNPCSLCATMRRGALNNAARDLGCNKLALGHHSDDVIETLLMGIFQEGRMHTFAPTTYLDRSGITVIRPFIYCTEQQIRHVATTQNFPILKSPCPLDGYTKRQYYKELLDRLQAELPDARKMLLLALSNTEQYRLWDEGSIVRKEDFEEK